jgi:hypothetical protein
MNAVSSASPDLPPKQSGISRVEVAAGHTNTRSHAAPAFPRELCAATWKTSTNWTSPVAPPPSPAPSPTRSPSAHRPGAARPGPPPLYLTGPVSMQAGAGLASARPAICAVNEPAISDAIARGRRAPGLPKAGRTSSYAWPSPRRSRIRESNIRRLHVRLLGTDQSRFVTRWAACCGPVPAAARIRS